MALSLPGTPSGLWDAAGALGLAERRFLGRRRLSGFGLTGMFCPSVWNFTGRVRIFCTFDALRAIGNVILFQMAFEPSQPSKMLVHSSM
jgi:hypothetical protein